METTQPKGPLPSTGPFTRLLQHYLLDLFAYSFLTNAVLASCGAVGLIVFTLFPPSSGTIRGVASILTRNAAGQVSLGREEIMWLYGGLTLLLWLLSKGLARLFGFESRITVKTRRTFGLLYMSGVFLTTWMTLMGVSFLPEGSGVAVRMPGRLGISIFLLILYLLGTGSLMVYLKIQNVIEHWIER